LSSQQTGALVHDEPPPTTPEHPSPTNVDASSMTSPSRPRILDASGLDAVVTLSQHWIAPVLHWPPLEDEVEVGEAAVEDGDQVEEDQAEEEDHVGEEDQVEDEDHAGDEDHVSEDDDGQVESEVVLHGSEDEGVQVGLQVGEG